MIMMKRFILITLLFAVLTGIHGQAQEKRIAYSTSIGTGIAMNEPACTPFTWQVSAHYHLDRRFAIGAGTGVSVYEKALIPLYGSIQFNLIKPRKLTPYIECNLGGSFAADKEANGGLYLSPSVGARLRLSEKLKLNFAIGYELQELERTKKHADAQFATEFKEELSHHSIMFKIGITL